MSIRVGRGRMIVSSELDQELAGIVMLPLLRSDITAPTVDSYSPLDNAIEIAMDANLVITFDENIFKGTGNILIKKTSNDSIIQTIDVSTGQVGISGNVVTINPSNLNAETGYYVIIASGVFMDLAENDWVGISVKTTWNFTTVDIAAPTVDSFVPADDALGVAADANLVINFSENIQKGTGDIVIKKTFDDSVVETIDVTSGLVVVSSAQVTINPTDNLSVGEGYYVLIDSGAFEDLRENDYTGIVDITTWSFRTVFADNVTTFGNLPVGDNKWSGGVLASNGCIYGMPNNSVTVLKIDPTDDSTSTFGNLSGDGKWSSGVSSNGYVYGISFNNANVLKIDVADDSVSTFASGIGGSYRYIGGVLVSDRYIYCVPFNATAILKIDISDDSMTTFGSFSGDGKWNEGILAPNGYIYYIPFSSTSVLKIDPSDDSTSTLGNLSGSNKWGGGALASNGCIYGMPFNATTILKIDTSDDTITTFGGPFTGGEKWKGGVFVESNGCIYGITRDGVKVLKIDTSDDSTSLIGAEHSVDSWTGGVLALNNVIYGIPYDKRTVLKIN